MDRLLAARRAACEACWQEYEQWRELISSSPLTKRAAKRSAAPYASIASAALPEPDEPQQGPHKEPLHDPQHEPHCLEPQHEPQHEPQQEPQRELQYPETPPTLFISGGLWLGASSLGHSPARMPPPPPPLFLPPPPQPAHEERFVPPWLGDDADLAARVAVGRAPWLDAARDVEDHVREPEFPLVGLRRYTGE